MTTAHSPQTDDPSAARLDFDAHAAGFSHALAHLGHAATKELDAANIDPKLRESGRSRRS